MAKSKKKVNAVKNLDALVFSATINGIKTVVNYQRQTMADGTVVEVGRPDYIPEGASDGEAFGLVVAHALQQMVEKPAVNATAPSGKRTGKRK